VGPNQGGLGVKAVAVIANHNFWLNTKTPNIRSLRDFGEKDRIAVPSIKVSTQAILLEMAVEKEWGVGQHTKLDNLVVQMPHPEALAAVLSRRTKSRAILPPRRFTRRRPKPV